MPKKGEKKNIRPVETREKALAMLTYKNSNEICQELNIPKATLSKWRKEAGLSTVEKKPLRPKEEKQIAQTVRAEEIARFVRETWAVIINSVKELNRRIEDSANLLEEINSLIYFCSANKEKLLDKNNQKIEFKSLLEKIKELNIIRTSELTQVLSVAYDKFALASGNATERVTHSFEDIEE